MNNPNPTKPQTNKKFTTNSNFPSSSMTNSFYHSESHDFSGTHSFASQRGGFRPNGESNPGVAAHTKAASSSVEQLIDLMSQVNGAVKAGEFNTQLATNIFALCQQLKTHGLKLEQTNKNDLNKVFVSLRQAVCQDSGQLGTPCRLKIMELIELRAMGWKSNLAHTQYYLNRPEKYSRSTSDQTQPTAQFSHSATSPQTSPTTLTNSTPPTHMITQPIAQHPAYVTAAPPNVPIQQFAFAQQPPPLFVSSEMPATSTQPTPGYFLIPAAGGWTPQMMPNMIASPQYAQSALQMRSTQPPDWMTRSVAPALPSHFGNLDRLNPMVQSAYALGGMSTKTNKQPQLREEITIKNADSGKIMGVKGRRVAVVEELSQTVISFQKVETNSPLRTLAITGSSLESIRLAKRLIEETIKRNVSPNRFELNGNELSQSTSGQLVGANSAVGDDEEEEDDPGISIEQRQDGTLKLSCTDPDMLQAAQQALAEYLTLRNNRMTAEERELRKERRKSMPLQSTSSTVLPATKSGVEMKTPESEVQTNFNGSLSQPRPQHLGSSPNLLAEEIVTTTSDQPPTTDSELPTDVLRYERSKLLKIRDAVRDHPLSFIPQIETSGANGQVEPKEEVTSETTD